MNILFVISGVLFVFMISVSLKNRRRNLQPENLSDVSQPKFNIWEGSRKIDFIREDGQLFYKSERVNFREQEVIGFYGVKVFSENGAYCVVFIDGYNENKEGSVALVETKTKTVLYVNKLNRPHICNVSNNGIVICNDWMSCEKEQSSFRVFDLSGSEIFAQDLRQNIGDTCLIDENGTVAVFDTCRSYQFNIVDISRKKLIKKIDKEYTIKTNVDIENRTISLFYEDSKLKVIKF
ncbi:hypothetical protein [Formosa sp. S-31]|uniref:hypothetical protein n=1 Tax=Formosa sp. S-31 TaxID=2790949 RepID=UPI003EBF0CD6